MSIKDVDIVSRLGEGNQGNVYLVKDRYQSTNNLYALKVYKINKDSDKLFHNEKDNLRTANGMCLHTPKIYDYGTVTIDNQTMNAILMEYIKGESLGQIKDRVRGKHLIEIAKELLSTVQCLHSNKIIHRDIKLDNIIQTYQDGRRLIKLVDFGFSCISYSPYEIKQCSLTSFKGTPLYISPEIATYMSFDKSRILPPIDPEMLYSNDIWACGIVLYHLREGRYPIMSNSFSEYIRLLRNVNINKINLSGVLAESTPLEKTILTYCLNPVWTERVKVGPLLEIINSSSPDIPK